MTIWHKHRYSLTDSHYDALKVMMCTDDTCCHEVTGKEYEKVRTKLEHRAAEESGDGGADAPAGAVVPASAPSRSFTSYINTRSVYAVPSTSGYLMPEVLRQAMNSLRIEPGTPPPLAEEAWSGQVYRGWRAFRLLPDMATAKFHLAAMLTDTRWETDTLDARCLRAETGAGLASAHDGRVIDPLCTCGIYLFNDRTLAMQQVLKEQPQSIIGECAGWGTVIEAEHGYRVEHARIEGLWTLTGTSELCETLASRYGVPCRNLWDALGAL